MNMKGLIQLICCGWLIYGLFSGLSWAAGDEHRQALRAIAGEIEILKMEYPQLAEFYAAKYINLEQCYIEYSYHTHPAANKGGWAGKVPNPNDDGIWFFIDFHDPASDRQIHRQPLVSTVALAGDQVAFMLMLEGRATRKIEGKIWSIIKQTADRLERKKLLQKKSSHLFVDNEIQVLAGQRLYLRQNLIFLETPPKVRPGWIEFAQEGKYCQTSIWEAVVGRGTKIDILAATPEGKDVRIRFRASRGEEKNGFEILLDQTSKQSFKVSCNEVFSDQPVDDPLEDCEPKTRQEVITCFGYPIYTCRQGDQTIFYYNLGLLGHRILGYHDAWIAMGNDQVIKIWGNI